MNNNINSYVCCPECERPNQDGSLCWNCLQDRRFKYEEAQAASDQHWAYHNENPDEDCIGDSCPWRLQ